MHSPLLPFSQTALGHVRSAHATVALVLLNILLAFLCLEVTASALLAARNVLVTDDGIDSRSHSSYYASQPWASQYWREFGDSRRQTYRPYVLWNRALFSGETINIDADGVRRTPGAVCGRDSLTVFVMGGSTVWGTGSPDWGTLPAYLQTGLQRTSDRPVCVVNYGESAYVSTQSLLRLLLQLRSGHIPDLVILYDGPNDVYSAYQTGRAGTHENVDQFAAAFDRSRKSRLELVAAEMRRTSLFWMTSAIVSKATHAEEGNEPLLTYRTMGINEKELAASVAETYLANYEVVDALARRYRFEFRSFWPPYIATGHKPLDSEERALRDHTDPDLIRLHRATYRAVVSRAKSHPRLTDIASTFDGYRGLLWIDDAHVTPVGNELLARRIISELGVPPGSSRAAE